MQSTHRHLAFPARISHTFNVKVSVQYMFSMLVTNGSLYVYTGCCTLVGLGRRAWPLLSWSIVHWSTQQIGRDATESQQYESCCAALMRAEGLKSKDDLGMSRIFFAGGLRGWFQTVPAPGGGSSRALANSP